MYGHKDKFVINEEQFKFGSVVLQVIAKTNITS